MAVDPAVSVVVPTRNRLAFLVECVDSVRRQTLPDWELIVVDDASDDGTADWLDNVQDSRIRTVRLPAPSERSVARNAGSTAARADFLVFLDDDDRMRPSGLTHLMAPFASNSPAVATVGGATWFDAAGQRRRMPHVPLPVTRDIWTEVVFGFFPGGSGRVCIRRDGLDRAGGWPESLAFAEDHELWLRLARVGPVTFVSRSVLEVRLHENQYLPPSYEAVHTELRRRYVAGLGEPEVRIARRALAAREHWYAGLKRSVDGEFAHAAREMTRALRTCPALIRSPVVAASLSYRLAQTVLLTALGPLGRRIRDTAVLAKRRILRAIKRRPASTGGRRPLR